MVYLFLFVPGKPHKTGIFLEIGKFFTELTKGINSVIFVNGCNKFVTNEHKID